MIVAADMVGRRARGAAGALLAIAALLLSVRLILALALIPPWQQPDEATHVALAELSRSRLTGGDTGDPAREAEILQSMAAHDWWRHRGVAWPVPVPVPVKFGQPGAGNRVVAQVVGITDPPAYFQIAGRVLNWFPTKRVTGSLYILRALSALFGLLTLGVVWLAARELAGPLSASIVTLLLALLPPFAVISTAATPDAMTNLLAACVWWQAAAAVRRTSVAWLAGVWATTFLAAASDRMGVPLVAVALVVSAGVLLRPLFQEPGKKPVALGVTIAVAIAAVGATAGVLQLFGETYGLRRAFSALLPMEGAVTGSRFIEFSWQVYRTWWYAVGSGRYIPPAWWLAIVVAIGAAAALGVGRQLFPRSRTSMVSRDVIALLVFGVAVQLLAVYWAYFRLGGGGQGRYLFPMLVPSLVLLSMGLDAWAPVGRRTQVAAGLIVMLGLLDATAWVLVAIPAYHASF